MRQPPPGERISQRPGNTRFPSEGMVGSAVLISQQRHHYPGPRLPQALQHGSKGAAADPEVRVEDQDGSHITGMQGSCVDPAGVAEVAAGLHNLHITVQGKLFQGGVCRGVVRQDYPHGQVIRLSPQGIDQTGDVAGVVVGDRENTNIGEASRRRETERNTARGWSSRRRYCAGRHRGSGLAGWALQPQIGRGP